MYASACVILQNIHREEESYTHLKATEPACTPSSTTVACTSTPAKPLKNPKISFKANVTISLDGVQVTEGTEVPGQRPERPEISQEARQKFQREVASLKRSTNKEEDSGNETKNYYKEYEFNEPKIYRDFKEQF